MNDAKMWLLCVAMVVGGGAVIAAVLFVTRELNAWYFKINVVIAELVAIRHALEIIPPPSEKKEEKGLPQSS